MFWHVHFNYFIVWMNRDTTGISISVSMIRDYLLTQSILLRDQVERLWCGSVYSLHPLYSCQTNVVSFSFVESQLCDGS